MKPFVNRMRLRLKALDLTDPDAAARLDQAQEDMWKYPQKEKNLLAAALDEAWERLRQSGSPLARPAYSRAMREVVAKRIIEMAQRGVQDREALVEDAVRFVLLTTNALATDRSSLRVTVS
jgi:hypothetical protein